MIAIVTDSTAYITREDARALGVVVVPMTYSIGGHQLYTESYIGENGMFESLLKKNPPGQRTSQATMSAFMSTFEELRSAGHQVLCLTISSRLSGTYSNAAIAARELGGTDISVVDSRTTAGGLFLMARAARRMIDEGMTLDQVTQRLKVLRDKVKVIFSVEDMGPLRRSGRLGVVRLSVSTILNIKPILKCADGSVVSCGIARGRHEQLRALERAVPEAAREMVVEHLCAEKEAGELMERVKLRGVPVLMRPVGPVLGIHLGLGCVGIAWIE